MSTSAFPSYRGHMEYVCLGCGARFNIEELHYTCPSCGGVFLLTDNSFDELKKTSAAEWRAIFDQRAASKNPALRGVFRFYELMAPVLEEEDILYLGEGNTPIVDSPPALRAALGLKTAYKNDGQNPSASFKDRGMACAFSFLKSLIRTKGWTEVLAICASTGDTSAAASLYASYVGGAIKSAVILPAGKVTPQQLAQPLGSGAVVLEVPGVFDDCMKVVEHLADNYRVALLNSKNAWRILGQESYAFEVAQWYDWES
jgi:threonine synthase